MTHIVAEKGDLVLTSADGSHFSLGLLLLQFHKAMMILRFLFFLVLFKVDRAKNQLGNTQQKRREFYCNMIPGIQQLRVYGGSIVEDIVGYRHDTKGNKGGCRLGQKLCDR